MQTMPLNDQWVIISGLHEIHSDVAFDDSEHSAARTTPNWFWTGTRWSSQSARSKLFASDLEAQLAMTKIRDEPNS
jgi:hypothetical protein